MARKNHIVRYKKRTLFQKVDMMESWSEAKLRRYLRMFYTRGLPFCDLVVVQRLLGNEVYQNADKV